MGGSVSQPVVRIELMGWKQPLINGHEVIRVVPPPSDTEVVSALAALRAVLFWGVYCPGIASKGLT